MSNIKLESLESIQDEKRAKRYKSLISIFKEAFGSEPTHICRAPGRVNLIGEHIDYCGYSVLPMAIDQDVSIALRSHKEKNISIANVNEYYKKAVVELDNYKIDVSKLNWYHYVLCGHKGVVSEESLTDYPGLELMIDGNVPKAAGMSSSSALVCASGLASAVGNSTSTERFKMAETCARCERFIGTQGGGMDQSISFLAEKGKAKLIGFNPLTVDDVALPQEAVFVIANSRVTSEKAMTSHFNVRVAECKIATQVLAKLTGVDGSSLTKLCELQHKLGASLEQMTELCDEHLTQNSYTAQQICSIIKMDERNLREVYLTTNTRDVNSFKLHQRAKHVFSEAGRVERFRAVCEASNDEDEEKVLAELGRLMNESHASCRDLYECSCPQLDRLTQLCRDAGAFGSRMTGAGWGGCTVSLLRKTHLHCFLANITKQYYSDVDAHLISSLLFATAPSAGAAVYHLHQ